MEREAFYATAAQVIPVLLLVLAFEARLQPRFIPDDRFQSWGTVFSFIGLISSVLLAEALALTALYRGKEIASLVLVVPVVILSLLSLIIFMASILIAETNGPEKTERRTTRWQERQFS